VILVIRVAVVIVAAATAAAVVMIVVIIIIVVVTFYLLMCKLVCFSHTNVCRTPAIISSIAHVVSRSLQ
jgi:hypothetical protein